MEGGDPMTLHDEPEINKEYLDKLLCRGGQGKSDASVDRDGRITLWVIVAAVVLGVVLVARAL